MRDDVLAVYPALDPARVHVILNGIDAEQYHPDPATELIDRLGVDPTRPLVVFVGRITRQKGISHLLDAALAFDPAAQIVLAAGAPDTEALAAEIAAKVERVQAERGTIVWLQGMLEKPEVIQLLSHATVFVCPSIYEPLGIVNLEAMACGAAVVATRTGGIPEVVVDGETGLLVAFDDFDPVTREPRDPLRFAADIAEHVNRLLGDPALAERFGKAGRERAISRFSWSAIAEHTLGLYRLLTA
jgi:starch synthase